MGNMTRHSVKKAMRHINNKKHIMIKQLKINIYLYITNNFFFIRYFVV